MAQIKYSELFQGLKAYILDLIQTAGGGTGPYSPSPHGLFSSHHIGSLADSQAPQFLKTDGSRQLIGNLSVADGITVDGVDISGFKSSYDLHVLAPAATAHAGVGVHSHQSNAEGSKLDHGLALIGLLDDDHTQYAHAEGSGTRRAYEAGRLNKSILAGNGLQGGGLLTDDRTLSVLLNSTWSGLSVDGNGLKVNTGAAYTWSGIHTYLDAVNLKSLTTARHIYPELTDTYDLGSSLKLWRKGWLSELDAVLFAQNTVTLLGGWLLITKDEGAVAADVNDTDTTVDFGKTMTTGDYVLFRAAGKVEYMQVGTLVSGTTYNVTRNLDGSGADSWPAGTPFAVLGQSGQGRIELNAYDTPRIQLLKQGATYNAATELIRIGDLNGNWGYSAQKWGVAIGEYASGKPNIVIDEDGNLKIRNYNNDVIVLSGTDAQIANVLKMSGTSSAIAIGATPPTSSTSGTGIWIDRTGLYSLASNVRQVWIEASSGKMYAGNGNVYFDANGITFTTSSIYTTDRTIKWGTNTKIAAYDYVNDSTLFIATNSSSQTTYPTEITIATTENNYNTYRSNLTLAGMYAELRAYNQVTIENADDGLVMNMASNKIDFRVGYNSKAYIDTNGLTLNGGFITGSTSTACRIRRTSNQSIPNATWTQISFSTAVFDDRPAGISSQWSSGSPTRLTCQVSGTYLIVGQVSFIGNSTGRRVIRLLQNGTTALAIHGVNSGTSRLIHLTVSTVVKLSVNDYIELGAYQESGKALDILTSDYSPVLSWARIA